jgi:hypothetical protein
LPKRLPGINTGPKSRLNKGVETMNCKFLGLLAMALLIAPMLANAQFTTLDYQGNVMSAGDQLTGSITLSGSGAAANVTSFQFNVSDGTQLGGGPYPIIELTTAQGVVTGAIVNWDNPAIGGSYIYDVSFSIGPQGDSYDNIVAGGPTGECIPYCGVMESNSTPGTWQVVRTPEIDPASAASGLTLLLGSIAVLRGRRTRTRAHSSSQGFRY